MKNKYTFILFFLIGTFTCAGQVTFQKTYGGTGSDEANGLQLTSDNGFILAGFTNSFSTDSTNVYLVKTDSLGNLQWTRTIGGNGNDQASSLHQTIDSGYIIIGYSSSFGMGDKDVYFIHTDLNGDTIWTKTIGGQMDDVGNDVMQTSDSGFIIVGNTSSYGAGNNDVLLIKTNFNGDTLWTRTFGGANNDYGYAVRQTEDHSYLIAGFTSSFGQGDYDVLLIKTDSVGGTIWAKTMGTAGLENAISFEICDDGGLIIAGSVNNNILVIKTDSVGDTLWTKQYGGINTDGGVSIIPTTDGGYIVTGWNSSVSQPGDVYLVKTNSVGDTLWTKIFGRSDYDGAKCVKQTKDSGYIICGTTFFFPPGPQDVYLIKTDSSGYSGCLEMGTNTIVSNPLLQITGTSLIANPTNSIERRVPSSVSSGGLETAFCTTVDIQSISPALFTFFPNPAYNYLSINQVENTIQSIAIFNLLSETVLAVPLPIANCLLPTSLNVSSLPPGIYFLQATTSDGIVTAKFVKE